MKIELHYFNVLIATVKDRRRVEVRYCSRTAGPAYYCYIEEEKLSRNFEGRRYAEKRESLDDTLELARRLAAEEPKEAPVIAPMDIGSIILPGDAYYRGSIIGL